MSDRKVITDYWWNNRHSIFFVRSYRLFCESVTVQNGWQGHCSGEGRQPSQPLSPLYHHLVLSLVDNHLALHVLHPWLLDDSELLWYWNCDTFMRSSSSCSCYSISQLGRMINYFYYSFTLCMMLLFSLSRVDREKRVSNSSNTQTYVPVKALGVFVVQSRPAYTIKQGVRL